MTHTTENCEIKSICTKVTLFIWLYISLVLLSNVMGAIIITAIALESQQRLQPTNSCKMKYVKWPSAIGWITEVTYGFLSRPFISEKVFFFVIPLFSTFNLLVSVDFFFLHMFASSDQDIAIVRLDLVGTRMAINFCKLPMRSAIENHSNYHFKITCIYATVQVLASSPNSFRSFNWKMKIAMCSDSEQ